MELHDERFDVSASPTHDEFMDPDMRSLWRRLGHLPGDLRLYGGTALALYLNHRHSTDFGFATPSPVINPKFVGRLPWMAGADLQGGPGMVDATIKGQRRSVKVTFMGCGHLIPTPDQHRLPCVCGLIHQSGQAPESNANSGGQFEGGAPSLRPLFEVIPRSEGAPNLRFAPSTARSAVYSRGD